MGQSESGSNLAHGPLYFAARPRNLEFDWVLEKTLIYLRIWDIEVRIHIENVFGTSNFNFDMVFEKSMFEIPKSNSIYIFTNWGISSDSIHIVYFRCSLHFNNLHYVIMLWNIIDVLFDNVTKM